MPVTTWSEATSCKISISSSPNCFKSIFCQITTSTGRKQTSIYSSNNRHYGDCRTNLEYNLDGLFANICCYIEIIGSVRVPIEIFWITQLHRYIFIIFFREWGRLTCVESLLFCTIVVSVSGTSFVYCPKFVKPFFHLRIVRLLLCPLCCLL